jgi:hypothetical protein
MFCFDMSCVCSTVNSRYQTVLQGHVQGGEKEDDGVGCKRVDVFPDELIFIMSGTLVKKDKSILITGRGGP